MPEKRRTKPSRIVSFNEYLGWVTATVARYGRQAIVAFDKPQQLLAGLEGPESIVLIGVSALRAAAEDEWKRRTGARKGWEPLAPMTLPSGNAIIGFSRRVPNDFVVGFYRRKFQEAVEAGQASAV